MEIVLEERVTLPGIGALHAQMMRAFAGSDPVAIDVSALVDGDFSLAQLLAAARIEADRCGRALVWRGADNPAFAALFERSGLEKPGLALPAADLVSCDGDSTP